MNFKGINRCCFSARFKKSSNVFGVIQNRWFKSFRQLDGQEELFTYRGSKIKYRNYAAINMGK
jgi:hypothetical protein